MNGTERVLRERRRADCYRLFSTCFYPAERRELVENETCLELAKILNELYPDAAARAGAAALHQRLTEVGESELRVDHAALFVGPFALKAPPYGSVYREQDHLLMGETTLAAAACYAAAGLTLTLHEPADHVAVELEFMHYLASLSAEARRSFERARAAELAEMQARFLSEHLGAWTPALCAAIERGAETGFYRALGACLRAFVDAEMHEVHEVMPGAH